MKFPNHSFMSCLSKICAVCLAFLGFGCSSSGDEPCMYGTISIDGMEENHNWMRNHPASFRKAHRSIATAVG